MKQKLVKAFACIAALFVLGGCKTGAEIQNSEAAATPTAAAAASQEPANAHPGYQSLLEGRLYMETPKGTTAEIVYPNGIMGAAAPADVQTRLVYAEGEEQLIFDITENFVFGGESIEEVAAFLLAGQAAELYDALPVEAGGTVVLLKPKKELKVGENAFVLLSALAMGKDSGIITISATLIDSTPERISYFSELAEKTLRSITSGERQLDLHERELALGTSTDAPVIHIAEGYAAKISRGTDFDVTYIIRVGPYNEQPPRLGVYIGGNPTLQGDSYTVQPTEVTGQVLGKATSWKEYRQDGSILVETVVPCGNGYLHAFIQAEQEADVEQLRQMAESIG